jgi:hypothetical protein
VRRKLNTDILILRPANIKLLIISTILFLVSACAEESVEWIDVPLPENVFYDAEPKYVSDTVEIPLLANSDLEYMLDMRKGNAVAYRWEAFDLTNPESLLAEFHGHTIRTSEEPGDVMFYKQGRGDSSNGYLVAPFDGVHGWYLSNETSNDITVLLTLSGFYEIP